MVSADKQIGGFALSEFNATPPKHCSAWWRCASRGRRLRGIAAELELQVHQINEDVGLAPQLVGDHRRLARNRRDYGNPDAAALHASTIGRKSSSPENSTT